MSQPTDQVLASELDGFGVAFWSWNFEDGKVFFSAEWYRMRGFEESDRNLTLSSCESRVHREDLEKLQRCREELIRGERSAYEQDYRVRHQNGSWIWIAERARAKLEDNGNAVGLVACDIDITARKLAEEGERLKEVLQATSDFICIADKVFKCVWRNRCLNNLRPDTPEFAIENAHPEWAVKVQLEEALPHAIQHGSWSGESAVIDQAGNEIPVSQIVLAHKDARGEVEYFSTIMRDISQQKAAEQALKKSERMYASLAAASPAAMIRLDAEGKQCSYVNPRWSEFFGQPSEAALGFGYCNFIHPEDWKACRPRFDEFVRDDSMTILEPQETRAIHANGSNRWVRVQFAKERDDAGNTTGYVGAH